MKRFLLLLALFLLPSAAVRAGDPLEKTAKEFAKKMQSMKMPRVALLSFPYHNGKISSGSSILAERMTTYMADMKGVRVVERNLLKKLLEEQHLSETGVLDASSTKQIGKVAGVDVIITGTLNDLNEHETELNARALKADTGEVVAARRVVVDRVWSDNPRTPVKPGMAVSVQDEPDEKPVPNEAIEIGYPAGRGGGPRGGGFGRGFGGR